ncbi:MAG: 1-deoxy-D-xylulose-5-phosphate reductoisomerase [Gammaproteobacteria bacterium]|nr:1-deoxy-D-xylulose-5-phosphate reductoisomerase [Gammaproteobacteria bacterium]
MENISILGSTGSIGQSTLDVVSRHPDKFTAFALTANTSVEKLFEQCIAFNPKYAVLANETLAKQLTDLLKKASCLTEVLFGEQALCDVASAEQVDSVMAAIVGSVGLLPTLSAVNKGKKIYLANKESLVMAGDIFMQAVKQNNVTLLPIDSEHNAIFQCLPAGYHCGSPAKGITKLLLTGSGGPFRERDINSFADITPEQAIAHPNWSMGPKISVDSATMMNKGLELIEACWLFDIDESEIQIVLHKQSIIHSMVAYQDGSVLAQMGMPDMRTPIAHCMAWPDRIESGVEPLNLFDVQQLDFSPADNVRFPCLRLAREAMQAGGSRMVQLNAANEVAVAHFLDNKIRFTDIANTIEHTLNTLTDGAASTLQQITEQDTQTRQFVESYLVK